MAQNRTFTISSIETLAPSTVKMTLEGDTSGLDVSGRFVAIDIPLRYLRRPISICDCSEGRLTLAVKVLGEGTAELASMKKGDTLEILCGLGNGFDTNACKGSALLLGGGIGTAPLVLLARQLKAKGLAVTAVIGFNKAEEIILRKELEQAGAEVIVTTLDGSQGVKGFVTDGVKACGKAFDYFYACGPTPMLKAVCTGIDIPGEVSTEERMGCGWGICYGCTCHTASGPRRVCKDGPVFKKEEMVW